MARRCGTLGLTVLMLRTGLCSTSSAAGFVSPGALLFSAGGGRIKRSPGGQGCRYLTASAKRGKTLSVDKLLQQQGFGTRKLCQELVKEGFITIMGREVTDPSESIVPEDGMEFTVEDEEWQYYRLSYILLNKPQGYECSAKPSSNPSVMDLLPYPFRGSAYVYVIF